MGDLMNKTPEVSTSRHDMKDIYQEVSTARQALRDSYQNLQNVADYCEKNYMEAPDKRKALESTMSLVTQTLASVACQVGVAARHVSDMLEIQSLVLQKEEAKVRYISQLLDVHVDKVARQKIGKLTTAKKFHHTQKIQNGQNNRPFTSYTRIPINFNSLDNTGHGFMDSELQLSKTGTMSRKISVKNIGLAHSSHRRNCRVREPVTPPIISAEKFPFPTVNGDLPSPSPGSSGSLSPSAIQPQQSGSGFSPPYSQQCWDLPPPPPPESELNGSSRLPAPIEVCTQPTDDLPPPPAPDYDMTNTVWPLENGIISSVCTQPTDDLPPPPAPDSDMTNAVWPLENADMESSTSSYDLPPPPPDL
ncbi:ABI gene family member 3 isoform X2 [Engystomops pustulosus]|uniref:ABI gene family member 3 isoform X2 n=1 Tax=Engystomops pustulosus TaxID=76066 RepID=UPI003AFB042A